MTLPSAGATSEGRASAATDRSPLHRYGPAAAVAVAALAIALSVATPQPHPGGDNAGYLSLAHSLVTGEGYIEAWDPAMPPHTKYPPVFPLALGLLIAAGASSWTTFKLLSALGVTVATLLAFQWAARRVGVPAGAGVALVALLSLGWLDASRWILAEPVFLAFVFLALWAVERAMPRSGSNDPKWLTVAAIATMLACLTRAAGAPLAVALIGALLLRRTWRSAVTVTLGLAIPGVWWLLRSRGGGGDAAYASEFWMVSPYEPALGAIGWMDLPLRAARNFWLYTGQIVPGEWWPQLGGGMAPVLGVVLVVVAGVGWWLQVRETGAGVVELFVPIYLALILVWPEVWSGNRFVLPLYPLVLVYAVGTLDRVARPLTPTARRAVGAMALLVMVLPALPGWLSMVSEGGACRTAVATGDDVFACHPPSFREFRDAAAWSGVNLPAGSVVLSRKPRIFHLLGGPAGTVFPFTEDPDAFLSEADRLGARFIVLDRLDSVSLYYLPAVIQARPGAFCFVVGWGGGVETPSTLLLGILAESARTGEPAESIPECPTSYSVESRVDVERQGLRIPLLTGG